MRQFLLADAAPGMTRDLAGADYHYLARVRRLRPGARLTVVDSAGIRYAAQVTEVGGDRLRLVVGARAADGADGAAGGVARTLTLIQALPRAALMDRIVRQATELGVRTIVPVVAERCQGRHPGGEREAEQRRWSRWQRIARQAAQQSGAAPPQVERPLPLAAFLARPACAHLQLVFEPGTEPLHRLLQRDAAAATAESVHCAIGPEGAYSPAELELFAAHGFHLVGLDAPVLRVDTAAAAALAATRQLLAEAAARSARGS